MHLAQLTLEEFRSFRRQVIDLPPGGLRIAGPNASGKSSILEAVAILSTTRSPRASADRELLNWKSGEDYGLPPYARLLATVNRSSGTVHIEITMQADPDRPGAVKKQVRREGSNVRAVDLIGTLRSVLFAPEDVELIGGSPSGRRRYLDQTISQMDRTYLIALSRYQKMLEQRNSLLKSLARSGAPTHAPRVATQLLYWDEELATQGAIVVARRVMAVSRLADCAAARFSWLNGEGIFSLSYLPTLITDGIGSLTENNLGPATNMLRERFMRSLEESRAEELRRGVTTIGPHRDDIAFGLNGMDLATFGSRGQQRVAVVAVKLAEADVMLERTGESPVVMLDDVLSELDLNHRTMLVDAVARMGSQLIITATDTDLLQAPSLAHLPLAVTNGGTITMQ